MHVHKDGQILAYFKLHWEANEVALQLKLYTIHVILV